MYYYNYPNQNNYCPCCGKPSNNLLGPSLPSWQAHSGYGAQGGNASPAQQYSTLQGIQGNS